MSEQSVSLSSRGQFRALYSQLKRKRLLASTPVIFCEGDSWFSTPLAMNLLDWIVSPSPEADAKGRALFGTGGLFFRAERSGDHASTGFIDPKRSMFTPANISDIAQWFSGFDFDMVLLSAGGNDFVAEFLKRTFENKQAGTLQDAVEIVKKTGRFEHVRKAYAAFIKKFVALKPDILILAHSYDYPLRIGSPGPTTLGNLGAIALLKKSVGPWIGPHIAAALPAHSDQVAFARRLIDGFVEEVLQPLKAQYPDNFDFVDLRGTLTDNASWFDEMHPTEAGFHALAMKMRAAIASRLPAGKTQPRPTP